MTTSAASLAARPATRSSDDFLDRFYPVLCRMAQARFKGREPFITDTISCGWEIYSAAKSDVTPGNVGYYAIKTVARRRWMQGSTRCPSAVKQTATQPTLFQLDFEEYFTCDTQQNPARIAAIRIDFNEWYSALNAQQQTLVNLLASGETTTEAALKLGCTAGNISQHRRRLAESWYSYQS